MDKQTLRDVLVQHIEADKASHEQLVHALTEYVAERPGDNEAFTNVFVNHVNEVDSAHAALLKLLDSTG